MKIKILKTAAAVIFTAVLAITAVGNLYPLIGAATVVIHEFSHILTARIFGIPMRKTVWHGGIGMQFDFSSVSYITEAFVCLSGCMSNYITAFAVFLIEHGKPAAAAPLFFICYSVIIGTVNILPVSSLDGGAVLRCILLSRTDTEKAYVICTVVSRITVIIFWLISAVLMLRYEGGISMMVLALYLLVSM